MDRALGMFGILIGLAGAAISLIGLPEDMLKAYPYIAEYRPTILVVSLAIAGLSFLLLIGAGLAKTKDVFLHLWEKAEGRRPPRLADMKLTEIAEGQLEIAYNYIKQAMQAEGVTHVLSFEQFRSMWETNEFVYGILWDRSEPTVLKIVGFISIFPLSQASAQKMLSCQLRGSQLRAEHLAREGEQPAAYFVGAIAASSWKAKGEVVRLLDGAIAELKLEKHFPLLLTSPFTSRGRSLARQFGFRHLQNYPDYGELWGQSLPVR